MVNGIKELFVAPHKLEQAKQEANSLPKVAITKVSYRIHQNPKWRHTPREIRKPRKRRIEVHIGFLSNVNTCY